MGYILSGKEKRKGKDCWIGEKDLDIVRGRFGFSNIENNYTEI